jgi:hypothetical protein
VISWWPRRYEACRGVAGGGVRAGGLPASARSIAFDSLGPVVGFMSVTA